MARRGVSRRGLFGLLRGTEPAERDVPVASDDSEPPESSSKCVRRPAAEVVEATPRPGGVFQVDACPLAVGDSVRVEAPGLFEAVVVARVHEHHVAACSSECPLDGSDVVFEAERDALVCPGCGSSWRLDGAYLAGPARYAIASYVVEAYDDSFRVVDR